MKEVFEELERLGFFKEYRPFSRLLFAEEIRKKTGADLEISNFDFVLKNKNWKITVGNSVSVSGKFSNEDYERIAEAIAVAKALIYHQIANEVKEYPVDQKIVWSAYNEAVLLGYPERDGLKLASPRDSKQSFDFPGKYKLGAMFVGKYKDNCVENVDLKNLLNDISDFFLHYDRRAYGKVVGDVDKFRFLVLALAKKGDFVAKRVYIALAHGFPIKYSDFKHLKKRLRVNVDFVPGE